MIRQRSGVDVTDDQDLLDSTFEHFQDFARSGGKGAGAGAAGCGWNRGLGVWLGSACGAPGDTEADRGEHSHQGHANY